MSELDFSSFMKESKTKEGLERQKERSREHLVRHGRADDRLDNDSEVEGEAVPISLKKPKQPPEKRPSIEEVWETLQRKNP